MRARRNSPGSRRRPRTPEARADRGDGLVAGQHRQIPNAAQRRGPARAQVRKPRGRGYSYDALKVLIEVWTQVGEPYRKYLAVIMEDSLDQLSAFGELDKVANRFTDQVRGEVVSMSPTTIDHYLAPTKAARYPAAKAATCPGNTLRSELAVRKAMDEMETRPGFLEIDIVAHCGHTMAG